jgi:DNA ligase-4
MGRVITHRFALHVTRSPNRVASRHPTLQRVIPSHLQRDIATSTRRTPTKMSDLEDNVPMADAEPAAPAIPTEADFEAKYPNRPRNVNPTLPFRVLYQDLFEPLLDNKKKRIGVGLNGTRHLKPHEIRRNIIDRFIARWRNEVGPDIWPAFRLILCEKDRDRNVYHLKEQKIGKLLVKVMKIARDSEDGNALVHWRQPGTWSRSAGDFALRCYGRWVG